MSSWHMLHASFFGPESHRQKSNWQRAWRSHVCRSRARTQQKRLRGAEPVGEQSPVCWEGAGCASVRRGTDKVMALFLAAGRTVFSLAEAQSTMPVPLFSKGRFEIGKGERKASACSLLLQGGAGAPRVGAEGNAARTCYTNRDKQYKKNQAPRNEPWNVSRGKSLLTKAPQVATCGWSPAQLESRQESGFHPSVPRVSISRCSTHRLVSVIWVGFA